MSRRENTERQILQALEDQIKETGMGGVGINACLLYTSRCV